jgi:YidC/Oxa1 family membrane protein insertase
MPSGNLNPLGPQSGMEKRLLLAFALMMMVLLGAQYFFKPAPSPKPVAPLSPKQTEQMAQKPPAPVAPAPASSSANPAATAQAVQAGGETMETIETDLYRVAFSNKGAVVKSWVLKKFRDSTGKHQLELVNVAQSSVPLPFAIDTKGQQLSFDPNQVFYVATRTPDNLGIQFQFSDGKTTVQKQFHFGQKSYLTDVRSEVIAGGVPVAHVLTWRGGFGDQQVRNPADQQHSVHYDASNSKLITKSAKDAKAGAFSEVGNFSFGGLEDNFFAAVALPEKSSSLEVRTYGDDIQMPKEEKPAKYAGVGVSTGPPDELTLFVGPKDTDLLRTINPKLEKLIDWGFFGVIAKPLFLWLNWVNDHWTFNYGWAIILVTLIINLVLFPFKITQLKSAKKMQALQPRLKAINEKYKGIGVSDPRKAQQNQETMALYKEAGVNPLGGCLPLLLQLPFLYAFYRVLAIAIELRNAPWVWVADLSQPETLPIHILPLVLIASQFLAQKLTPATGMDPNQQKMMMFMPLLYGFMFYHASAGLVLYWLTSNVAMIAQQLLINRMMPSAVPAPAPAVAVSGKAPVKRAVKK